MWAQDQRTDCPGWAAAGECERNPGAVLPSCPDSCDVCGARHCADTNATLCSELGAQALLNSNIEGAAQPVPLQPPRPQHRPAWPIQRLCCRCALARVASARRFATTGTRRVKSGQRPDVARRRECSSSVRRQAIPGGSSPPHSLDIASHSLVTAHVGLQSCSICNELESFKKGIPRGDIQYDEL